MHTIFHNKITKIFIVGIVFLNLSYDTSQHLKPIVNKEKISPKKNLILVITDGFGFSTLSMVMNHHYHGNKHKNVHQDFLNFVNKSFLALTLTNSYDSLVTDSAAAATSIATGQKTKNFFIGINHKKEKLISLSNIFKKKKKSIGIVSNTRVTHATPAAFYAHNSSRNNELAIAQSISPQNSHFDLLLGGGLGLFQKSNSKLIKDLRKKGYQFVYSKNELIQVNSNNDTKLIGLFAPSHLPYKIDRVYNNNTKIPSLKDMASKAINILDKNKNGFFLMIESGLVDISEHDNDMGTLIHELVETTKLIKSLTDYVEKNPETLIIFTSDHETGGLGLTYFFPEKEDASRSNELKIEFNIPAHTTGNSNIFYQKKQIYKQIIARQKMSLKAIWKSVFNEVKTNDKILSIDLSKFTKLINQNFPILVSKAKLKSIFLINDKNEIKIQDLLKKYHTLVKFNGGPKQVHRIIYAIIVNELITPYFGITWNTGGHIANLVPTFIYSPNDAKESILHKKIIQNTDLFNIALNLIH